MYFGDEQQSWVLGLRPWKIFSANAKQLVLQLLLTLVLRFWYPQVLSTRCLMQSQNRQILRWDSATIKKGNKQAFQQYEIYCHDTLWQQRNIYQKSTKHKFPYLLCYVYLTHKIRVFSNMSPIWAVLLVRTTSYSRQLQTFSSFYRAFNTVVVIEHKCILSETVSHTTAAELLTPLCWSDLSYSHTSLTSTTYCVASYFQIPFYAFPNPLPSSYTLIRTVDPSANSAQCQKSCPVRPFPSHSLFVLSSISSSRTCISIYCFIK